MIISSLPSSSSSSLITPRSSPFRFSSLRHLLTLATFLLSSSFLPLHLSILPYLYLLLLPPSLSLQPFLLLSFSYYLYLPPSYLPSFLHFFPYRPLLFPFPLSLNSTYFLSFQLSLPFCHFFFFPPPSPFLFFKFLLYILYSFPVTQFFHCIISVLVKGYRFLQFSRYTV